MEKFKSFNDSRLPLEAIEALQAGKTIIRQVMVKPTRANGTPSSHPFRIQTQGLKSRKVTTSGVGVSIGALLNSGTANGNSLEIVNATNWLAIDKATFDNLFGDIFGDVSGSVEATLHNVTDGGEVINADILNPAGVEITVQENFVPQLTGDLPKTKGDGGEVVTASFMGRQLPVYRHTNLVLKNSAKDFFIDPNATYSGTMESPVLGVPATEGVTVSQG